MSITSWGSAKSCSRLCASSAARASSQSAWAAYIAVGESREWLKTKCSETGVFAITGFSELGDGKLDAVYLAEARDGVLCPAGQVRFFVGKGVWHLLNERRAAQAK